MLAVATFISALGNMKKEYNQIYEATEITISLRKIHLCAILMNFLSLGMHCCIAHTKLMLYVGLYF